MPNLQYGDLVLSQSGGGTFAGGFKIPNISQSGGGPSIKEFIPSDLFVPAGLFFTQPIADMTRGVGVDKEVVPDIIDDVIFTDMLNTLTIIDKPSTTKVGTTKVGTTKVGTKKKNKSKKRANKVGAKKKNKSKKSGK
jgi:hypothetical protein